MTYQKFHKIHKEHVITILAVPFFIGGLIKYCSSSLIVTVGARCPI